MESIVFNRNYGDVWINFWQSEVFRKSLCQFCGKTIDFQNSLQTKNPVSHHPFGRSVETTHNLCHFGTAGSAIRADPFFLVASDGPATVEVRIDAWIDAWIENVA